MKFLGNVLATIVGIFIFCMIFFFGIIIIGAIAGSGDDTVSVKKNSVIELDLSKVSLDYAGKTNYKDFNYFEAHHDGVTDILNAIEAAKNDNKIKGISILNNQSQLGLAQSKAVRDKLDEFKKSGKFVYSYSNGYSQGEYYLNSVADQVYLNPMGEIDFKGLSAEILYMKELQEKAGVKMEVIRHGKFKSAVEPYLAQEMSPENREQMTVLLNSVWNTIVTDISKSRKLSIAQLDAIANSLGARTPELALANKLIDKIAYEDEYHDAIRAKLKLDKKEKYDIVSITDYAQKAASTVEDYSKEDIIAVIYAQGEIAGGEGDVNIIGEGSINRSLKEAREDDDVKAIVLRVNSPGGSALTSELIWREIEITKKVKPVVVSMGNYAASGGYYIAANADRIFAEPNTITGSIGVFGMLPNMSQLSKNIGINAEQVKTHENASGYSIFEPIDENFKGFVLESIEKTYATFLKRVADGRKMTTEQVDVIAQGRVWTGIDAHKLGLVDEIGGLDAAIKYAAKLGKTNSYRTENFPEYEKSFEDMLANFTGMAMFKTKEQLLKEQIGEEGFQMLEQIKRVKSRKGIQAMMPYELNIH
ncbi:MULTISPECIES: signal peptide peptidase SppA [unclassified Flavobacterium]|uniref:signal peptide peptidase SppA n=1 Tax=unclassified Flavobacterium TaxID=196869 RepID=UPI001290AAEE|nr:MULTISPECIES: signal peptide peptidase SppA [unclassified Flavobacterium]MQP51777.1 signal peptide peptidase SppA [Flavobacterium sp. LMO9]MQP61647.1 signal peptide peptidase SppA [Flavobacterium sp. LMO6]